MTLKSNCNASGATAWAMCPAPAIHNAHGGVIVSWYSQTPASARWRPAACSLLSDDSAMEKSPVTPQARVFFRSASSVQNCSPALCALGRINPQTLPPHISPSSQPKSWSSSRSNVAACAGAQRLDGPMLDFRFQATAAQRAFDAPVRIKERLGADLLGAGTLGAGDDTECHWFTAARGFREGLENDVSHP